MGNIRKQEIAWEKKRKDGETLGKHEKNIGKHKKPGESKESTEKHRKKGENRDYNIARVLALCKSYCAAMNKIFIYARACVNKDFVHYDVFSCFFVSAKYPKIDGNEAGVALGYRLMQLLRIFRALKTSRVHP